MKQGLNIKRFFASLMLLAVSTLSWAEYVEPYDFKVKGIYYEDTGDYKVRVTCRGYYRQDKYPYNIYKYDPAYDGTVEIPDSVTTSTGRTYRVTGISSNAFRDCNITSIKIPQSVKTIGSDAFYSCKELRKAEFASIEHILSISFANDQSNPLYYAHNLYIGGKRINSIVIPEDSTDIRKYAFVGCPLNTLIIGPNVKTVGNQAFSGDRIKKVIWLPEVLPSGSPSCAIGTVNYYSSSNYSSIVQQYPKKFYCYPLLTSRFEVDGVIYAPLSTTECDVIDCNYDSNPVSPEIGPTITYKNRTLNVRNVMPYACYDDKCIVGDLAVSNQGYIGERAFYGCTGLQNLSVTNNGYIGAYAFYGSKITQAANIANKGLINSYAFSSISGDATCVIDNTGSLGQWAFSNSKFTSVNITNNVTSIGENCFANDSIHLEAIINNNGNIMNNAFASIKSRQTEGFKATINNKGSLGQDAFSGSRMSEVSITSKVDSIGQSCFANGSITQRATIENHGKIGRWAFSSIIGGFDAYIRSSGPLPQSCFKKSKMKVVEIGNGVTSIGDSCFQSTTFTQATIGNKVDSIGKYSFAGATGFTNIILPNSVKFMGECSFKGCTTMKSITVSRGLNEIKNSVFSGCRSLASLFVPNTIQAIRNNVFDGCSSLKILTFEDKNGEYNLGTSGSSSPEPLFKTCGLDSVYVGGRLTYEVEQSPNSPFKSHSTLRAVRFTDIKQEIYPKEFQDCTNLQNVYMGATMNPIGDYAFSGCTSLARFNVGPAVKRLGSYSFNGCSALKHIDLANTDSIMNNAFMGCTSLPEISIPSSTILIQNQVFKGCTALKNLYIKDRTETLRLGINANNTSYKGITGAGTPIFSDCPLDSVYIGGPIAYSSTKASGYSPFFYNESLRSVYISNKEKTVYEYEFYNCLGLKNLKLGPGVTTIKQYGFQSCIGLQHFEFASTLQTIGANAFSDCTNMMTIISHASTPPVCGAQALQDINFFNCKVYVPEGAVDAYMAADQWKNFFIESFEEEATGDIDGDGEIDVADIQHIINMIVGTEVSTSMADINGDGDVDIADIQAIINIIISNANADVNEARPMIHEEVDNNDHLSLTRQDGDVYVALTNDFTYSAFQLQVTLPDGCEITSVELDQDRAGELTKYVKKVGEGQYIVLAYSLDGNIIKESNDNLLVVHTSNSANHGAQITKAVFSTPSARSYKLPIWSDEETGVNDVVEAQITINGNTVSVGNPAAREIKVYSLNGSLLRRIYLGDGQNSFTLPQGIYVINKQKIVVSK